MENEKKPELEKLAEKNMVNLNLNPSDPLFNLTERMKNRGILKFFLEYLKNPSEHELAFDS